MDNDTVRELPHTADIGFEVRASSLDRLFRLAARGLLEALGVEAGEGRPVEGEPLELRRPDLERLLVSWLRELLHRSASEGQVPEVEEVRVTEAAGEEGAALEARIAWRRASSEPVREIKGVTYHGLQVRQEDGVWHAQVVLDV